MRSAFGTATPRAGSTFDPREFREVAGVRSASKVAALCGIMSAADWHRKLASEEGRDWRADIEQHARELGGSTKKRGITYLAAPYSHPSRHVMYQRYTDITKHAAQMMREGFIVFSPITHSHPIAAYGELPRSWEYWQEFDRTILEACQRIRVLMLPGWEQSAGIAGELEIAEELGLTIEFTEP